MLEDNYRAIDVDSYHIWYLSHIGSLLSFWINSNVMSMDLEYLSQISYMKYVIFFRSMSLMLCAKDMAHRCGVDLTVNPVVMVTDNVRFRRRVVTGLYRGMVASNITPHHSDNVQGRCVSWTIMLHLFINLANYR